MRVLRLFSLPFVLLVGDAAGQQPSQLAFDALQKQVDTAAVAKDFASLEALTKAQIALVPQSANAHYNLACALAVQGKKDEALQTLTKAAAFGFTDAALLEQDPDLASLRGEGLFAATLSIVKLNQKAPAAPVPSTPGTPSAPSAPAVVESTPSAPLTKQEIIDYLKARVGTDGPHPQKEAVNLELRELIKKRGVSFRYSTLSDMSPIMQVGGIGSMIDAVQANYGTPKPPQWLWGEWNVSTTATRTFSLGDAVNKMGFLIIEPDGKYLWKLKADDEANKWIDGKWREPTVDEMKWMGGAGVVLLGGEQGYDWIVHRDYTANDGQDWITIAVINSRQTFRSGLRVP